MKNTKIEWCDHTVNLWWGCSEVSEACANCYARGIAKRFGKDCWGKSARALRLNKAFGEIVSLNAAAKKRRVVETVFINSMSDFFDVAVAPEIRLLAWEHFKAAQNLKFLILTKRARVMANHIALYSAQIPDNVHFGITAENQARLDERMNELKDVKRRLFLSCEPLLERIDIAPYAEKIDWVICGGETGRNARLCSTDWAQGLFEQTRTSDIYGLTMQSNIPFFFKKFGDNSDIVQGQLCVFATFREYPAWHSSAVERSAK